MSKTSNAKRARQRAEERAALDGCVNCGAPLHAARSSKKFCSERCRAARWRLDQWVEKQRRFNEDYEAGRLDHIYRRIKD